MKLPVLSSRRSFSSRRSSSSRRFCRSLPSRSLAAQAPPPPATDTVAPAIPGVTAAGTKVTVIKEGFQGTEGPIALPDGSVVFTETNASRLTRIDKDNNVSTFLENTNGSNGLAFDAKGRMISVQTTPGQTRVGVIYPKGSETTFEEHDRRDGPTISRSTVRAACTSRCLVPWRSPRERRRPRRRSCPSCTTSRRAAAP